MNDAGLGPPALSSRGRRDEVWLHRVKLLPRRPLQAHVERLLAHLEGPSGTLAEIEIEGNGPRAHDARGIP